jgi:hypothetical protein
MAKRACQYIRRKFLKNKENEADFDEIIETQ